MAFEIKEQYLDLHTGMHVIRLHHPESKREHLVQVHVGLDACPACGHVTPREDFDASAHVAETIEKLDDHHAQILAYAARHRVPIK